MDQGWRQCCYDKCLRASAAVHVMVFTGGGPSSFVLLSVLSCPLSASHVDPQLPIPGEFSYSTLLCTMSRAHYTTKSQVSIQCKRARKQTSPPGVRKFLRTSSLKHLEDSVDLAHRNASSVNRPAGNIDGCSSARAGNMEAYTSRNLAK